MFSCSKNMGSCFLPTMSYFCRPRTEKNILDCSSLISHVIQGMNVFNIAINFLLWASIFKSATYLFFPIGFLVLSTF